MSPVFISTFLVVMAVGLSSGAPNSVSNQAKLPQDGCECQTFNCGCCVWMDVPEIYLNDTACINFAYDPKDYGIAFTFTLDGKTLINETISARNPPPICLPAPYLEDFFDLCIHFTDLDISEKRFHGCVQLEARMWWVYVVAEINLGCFDTSSQSKRNKQLPYLNIPIPFKKHLGLNTTKNRTIQEIELDERSKYDLVPLSSGNGSVPANYTISESLETISEMLRYTNGGALTKATTVNVAIYSIVAIMFFLV